MALITGASSGIGRSVALLLAQQGWDLVLIARAEQSLQDAQRECAVFGGQALTIAVDVGIAADVDLAFSTAVDRFARIDAVVNAAAAVAYGRFEDIPADVFDRVITTNLLGAAHVVRASLGHFRAMGGGRLVIMGSLLGKIAVPLMSPYVTSKWGVHALARMVQIEARQVPGVEVSLISPGSVNTPAYSQAANYTSREGRPPPPVDPPEKVARAIVQVLAAPRRDRSVGLSNHLVVLGFRLLPSLFDAIVTPLISVGGLSRRPIVDHSGTVFEPNPDGDAAHGVWGFLGLRNGTGRRRSSPGS